MFTASVIEPSTLNNRALIIISNVHADLAHSYCRTNGFVLRQRLRARVLYASSHRCPAQKKIKKLRRPTWCSNSSNMQ